MKYPAGIAKKAGKIKLIAMDVDGVMTGGEIIVFDSGEELKIWNVKDRLGFHLVRLSGAPIKFAWITGRVSKQVSDRAREIGIEKLYQGCSNKREALKETMEEFGVKSEETVFIGDDLIDIPALREAGFAISPSDAPAEVRKEADYITKSIGGRGVIREVIEIVLKSQGLWAKAVSKYQ
ncbi:MAG TPA: hypothetical protein DEE98_00515 [Elusimicrobia bacterium]|nr:MAG: hypothetical protein A2278_03145 [Elusimicrobia bacterium RIFOXYA12_FULL_49_49]OGS09672.1 MAG: hypothetical protein A2386_01205 [Elusimicrobia bacterium RIFOXYB1_FULL_48_9]OGS15561.1 MAG: hypothetical protein A2251_03395 [Elusimicrobia bacterium RIFOXYA2_FULL_47_53]OGS26883.1 MAG: hypothetical protein A2339_07585 [Elusimicrobia bacterium RIFOXYB12_FULL_50_12]OGS30660.1 MAG: hypothetical protein A2323_07200 [Elusimicrobia bacterium RIFOXYB2_FULL_46_23]HBU68848.1 hypothetical protein [El